MQTLQVVKLCWKSRLACCHAQAADREAEVRSLRCQHATLADDSETAQLRVAKAESQMHNMLVETQHLRDAASQAIAQEQVDQQGRLLI